MMLCVHLDCGFHCSFHGAHLPCTHPLSQSQTSRSPQLPASTNNEGPCTYLLMNPTGHFFSTNAQEQNCWVRRCVNTEHAENVPNGSLSAHATSTPLA